MKVVYDKDATVFTAGNVDPGTVFKFVDEANGRQLHMKTNDDKIVELEEPYDTYGVDGFKDDTVVIYDAVLQVS